jgi:hypothetical protein
MEPYQLGIHDLSILHGRERGRRGEVRWRMVEREDDGRWRERQRRGSWRNNRTEERENMLGLSTVFIRF